MELESLNIGDRVVAQTRRGAVRGNISAIQANGNINITTSGGIKMVHFTEITRMVRRAK